MKYHTQAPAHCQSTQLFTPLHLVTPLHHLAILILHSNTSCTLSSANIQNLFKWNEWWNFSNTTKIRKKKKKEMLWNKLSLHVLEHDTFWPLSRSVHTSPNPGLLCKGALHHFELILWKACFPLPKFSATRVITSTMALGSSSARKSCRRASMMFFQPSRRMSPWRWAKWNTVFAAIWALGLLPKTVGRFSID